jgi:hypothetical protein
VQRLTVDDPVVGAAARFLGLEGAA